MKGDEKIREKTEELVNFILIINPKHGQKQSWICYSFRIIHGF